MEIKDLDQRFLLMRHDLAIGTAWRRVKHAPGEIRYLVIEMPSATYVLLDPAHLQEAVRNFPEEQVTMLTLGELLEQYPAQEAFEISRYGRGEAEFLLDESPRKRVLFQKNGQVVGVLADQEKEATLPSTPKEEAVEDRSSKARRHVNVCLLDPGLDNKPVPSENNLTISAQYVLRLEIGPFAEWSVVCNPRTFPGEKLPPSPSGHWLQIIVDSPAFRIENLEPALFLPEAGPSQEWNCSLIAPSKAGTAELFINIYFKNVLIQALKLAAQIGEGDRQFSGYEAKVIFTLTDGLTSVEHLPAREANISTLACLDGRPYLLIKGKSEKFITLQLDEGKMRTAIHAARKGLENVHFEVIGGGPLTRPQKINRLNPNNGKLLPQFRADIAALGPLGYRLLVSLFGSNPEERKRTIQFLQSGPAKIQVSRTRDSKVIFPWALVYDIPLGSDPHEYHDCQLLLEWPSHSLQLASGELADCPYADTHTINTLCPFGFWGIRHTIDQPSGTAQNTELHMWIQPDFRPRKMVIGLSTALKQEITRVHLQNLKSCLGDCLSTDCITRHDLCEGLKQNDLEFLYFYCHGRHEEIAQSGSSVAGATYLEIGKQEQIKVEDLSSWSDYYWDASQHWRPVSPLVFINGCHTMDITPDDLVSFVDAFAGANAAGVIGTEITLAQPLASEVAEIFFQEFNKNKTVGESLRAMRLLLLSKGNLLGLAYTPYCCADLQILRQLQH